MEVHIIDKTQSIVKSVQDSVKNSPMNLSVSNEINNALFNIEKQKPRIVLINWVKDESNITSLCKKIRRIKSSKYIYVVVIINDNKTDDIETLLDSGADDFIIKPFSQQQLTLRLQVAHKNVLLNDKLTNSQKKLIKLAKEDPSTTLYNRRALLDEAINEMKRSARELKPYTVLMFKVTNFDTLLDTFGHIVLDKALFEFSRRLKNSFRPYDKAGRYGTTVFLSFLPGTNISNTQNVAERIIDAVTGLPFVVQDEKIKFSISIGIAGLDTDEVIWDNNSQSNSKNEMVLDACIKQAETAMEEAAKNGKNNIKVFND